MTSQHSVLARVSRVCLLSGALAITFPFSSSAQEDTSALDANLVDVVDVVLVNVEVWVADRKGNPIDGLSEADFELFENGRPMEITHLAEFGSGQEVALNASSEPPTFEHGLPAPATTNAPAHLVLYFDQLHLSTTSVRRIAQDLARFLADGQIPPSRVAILSQGYELALEAGFGSTLDQLISAIERISESEAHVGGALDARLAMRRMQQIWETSKEIPSPCRVMSSLSQAEIVSRVAELRHRFRITLDNLHTTTRFLAGLPGPKMLVLVSDSLELQPGRDLLRFAKNVCPNERDLDELSLLGDGADLRRAMIDFTLSANANRVTFFPLQASGLMSSSVFGAENRALDTVAGRGVDSTLRQVQQDGLLSLAEETGGVAAINRNSFKKPLESIAREMQSYYSLAYTPDHSGTGDDYSIEVRVKVPRAVVRHRSGYRDKSAREVRDERLDGAIAFGIMDNPLALRLAVGTIRHQADGTQSIPLHVLVPADGLAFIPNPQPEARLEVVVRASDATTGEVVELTDVLTADPPAAGFSMCDLNVALSLPPGVYVLGVAARDLATNIVSVVSTTIAIGSLESTEPAA